MISRPPFFKCQDVQEVRFINGVLGCTGHGRNSYNTPASPLGWLPTRLALMGLGHPHRLLSSWVQRQPFSALQLLCLHHLQWPLNPLWAHCEHPAPCCCQVAQLLFSEWKPDWIRSVCNRPMARPLLWCGFADYPLLLIPFLVSPRRRGTWSLSSEGTGSSSGYTPSWLHDLEQA